MPGCCFLIQPRLRLTPAGEALGYVLIYLVKGCLPWQVRHGCVPPRSTMFHQILRSTVVFSEWYFAINSCRDCLQRPQKPSKRDMSGARSWTAWMSWTLGQCHVSWYQVLLWIFRSADCWAQDEIMQQKINTSLKDLGLTTSTDMAIQSRNHGNPIQRAAILRS